MPVEELCYIPTEKEFLQHHAVKTAKCIDEIINDIERIVAVVTGLERRIYDLEIHIFGHNMHNLHIFEGVPEMKAYDPCLILRYAHELKLAGQSNSELNRLYALLKPDMCDLKMHINQFPNLFPGDPNDEGVTDNELHKEFGRLLQSVAGISLPDKYASDARDLPLLMRMSNLNYARNNQLAENLCSVLNNPSRCGHANLKVTATSLSFMTKDVVDLRLQRPDPNHPLTFIEKVLFYLVHRRVTQINERNGTNALAVTLVFNTCAWACSQFSTIPGLDKITSNIRYLSPGQSGDFFKSSTLIHFQNPERVDEHSLNNIVNQTLPVPSSSWSLSSNEDDRFDGLQEIENHLVRCIVNKHDLTFDAPNLEPASIKKEDIFKIVLP
eukprot:Nk52_evm1s1295 gene=Nk52_evmTU1s1295